MVKVDAARVRAANQALIAASKALNTRPAARRSASSAPAASASTSPPTTPAATARPCSCGTARRYAGDQRWTWDGSALRTLGRCLDVTGNGTANGTLLQLWDCNGGGAQQWVQQANGSLRNPQSGRCLDSPSGATANGARLQICDCNGSAAQEFRSAAARRGQHSSAPAASASTSPPTTPAATARPCSCGTASPSPWTSTGPGTARPLRTLGRCLDVTGNGTANGTLVQLWDCNGGGAPAGCRRPTARCATRSPAAASTRPTAPPPTAPGCRLWDCNGSAAQKFLKQ